MGLSSAHKSQLPRWSPWTLERGINLAAGVAGILPAAAPFLLSNPPWSSGAWDIKTVLVWQLLALVLLGALYIGLHAYKKLHRYAESVYFTHYVNHRVRDYVAAVNRGRSADFPRTLEDIADAASVCFSLLVGKRCRCSIKEVDAKQRIETVARDSYSASGSSTGPDHTLKENTDFENLWYGKNGCARYFLGADLKSLWRAHNYRNSSFKALGEPHNIMVKGLTLHTFWPLPYNSTIVWPIRFIPDGVEWPPHDGNVSKDVELWGFLCIDCKSRNAFAGQHAPEVGAAIADALAILFESGSLRADEIEEKKRDRPASQTVPS
jgi:hypothetical protein